MYYEHLENMQHMNITLLSEDNAFDYEDYLTADVAENLSRDYYKGIVVEEDEGDAPLAAMVFEIAGIEEQETTEAVIHFLKIEYEEAAGLLFDSYKELIESYDVKKSTFMISVSEEDDSIKEKKALADAGFTVRLTEGDEIITDLKELLTLPIMKSRKVPDTIFSLNEMTTRGFRNAISKSVMSGRKGVCPDLALLPFSWFDSDVSCYSEHDGNVDGLLLFHKMPSGMIAIQLMVAMSGDAQKILLGMMRKFVISLEENYGPGTKVVLNRHNYSSLALTEKLLPGGFGIPVYKGSRQEQ